MAFPVLHALLITLAVSLTIKDSVVFTSKSTPNSLVSYFNDSATIFNLSSVSFESIEATLPAINFLFLIDITLSKSFWPFLNTVSSIFEVSYISISKSSSTSNFRINAHHALQEELKALKALINYISASDFVLLGPATSENIEFSNKFKAVPNFDKYVSYSNSISLATAKSIAVKMIKVNGITSVVVSDSSSSISVMEAGLTETRFNKPGAILIYTSFSFPVTNILGSLLISEFSEIVVADIAQYHYFGVLRVLSCFNTRVNQSLSVVDRQLVNQVLSECNLQPANFSIFNVQEKAVKRVGYVIGNASENSTITITEPILYLGNITTRVRSVQATITLSIANGTNDPYNSFHYEMLAYLYQGSLHAVNQINQNNEIPNFTIKLTPTDCGMFWYEQYWYLSCHSRLLNSLGVAYITSFFGEAIKGNIYSLRTLRRVIPQVSPLGISVSLDNKTEYPELVKLESSFDVFNGAKMTVLRSLGYYSIMLIMANDTEYRLNAYISFRNLILQNGMKVVDYPPELEIIKNNYTRDDFEKYKPFFEWVRSTGCSVFFFSVNNIFMVIEGLYDVGFRKGEFILFHDTGVLGGLQDIEEPFYHKRKELVEGAIVFSYKEWAGELGERIHRELSEKYQELTYMCMTYDSVMVIKEAINYLLAIGGDFEDYLSLMNSIRKNKFIGCLGNVFFDHDGNNRASGQFLFQQIYFNETSSKLQSRNLLYFDRFSSQTITQINSIVWPTGVPIANFRPYNRCPFDAYQIIASDKGKNALYGASAAIFAICIIIAITGIYKHPNTLQSLTERAVVSFEDFAFFSFFLLEFFQYLALGPDQNSYKSFLNNFQVLLSLNFDLFFDLTFSKFWTLFNAVCAITIYCVAMFPVYLGFLEARLGDSFIHRNLSQLSRLTVPYLCHLGYMPIISMLLNIFNCTEGVGSNYSDSYLAQDCTIFCYTGLHQQYVIFVSIFMSLFVMLTVYYRPYFEQNQHMLNVKTKSSYLHLLSTVQTSIVVLNKTLKIYSQVAHGIAVSSILFFFLLYTALTEPFNYGRAKASQCISLIASIWAIGISTIFINLSLINVWIIVEFLGLVLIAVFGMIFSRRYTELLYSEKGISISSLFIFQFFKDYSRYESIAKSLEDLPRLRNFNKIQIDSTSKDIQIEQSYK